MADFTFASQALIDGPSTSVPRQSVSYKKLTLTPFVLKSLPRAAGPSTVKKQFEAAEVAAKWEASAWAKKIAAKSRRQASTDFERFTLMINKQVKRDAVRKALYKEKKASA
jgi:large subunit ribosomal protein L14e